MLSPGSRCRLNRNTPKRRAPLGSPKSAKSRTGQPLRGGQQQKPIKKETARAPGKPSAKDWRRGQRLIPGHHSIKEAIAAERTEHHELWLQPRWSSQQTLREIEAAALAKRVKVVEKSETALSSFYQNHQGALLWSEPLPTLSPEELNFADTASVLLLDQLEDPNNFGAIIRTAWLLGVDAIFYPEERSVGLSPAAHKVACGGVEYVNMVQVQNFNKTCETLKEKGFWVYGLSHLGKTSVTKTKFPQKVALFVGSEEKGLRSTSERMCDDFVLIPQTAAAASFNASVATSIVLFESLRQREVF